MPDFGELAEKAEKLARQHSDQVKEGLQKLGDEIDQKTGHRFSDQIKQGEQQVENHLGNSGQNQ